MPSTEETTPAAAPVVGGHKIRLTGVQETMLITLHARMMDCESANPILGDEWSGKVLAQVDYDFAKLSVDYKAQAIVAMRGNTFDKWTSEFLRDHPDGATIVSLGCGLECRSLRLDWARPGIRWIDADLPDIVDLRRKLLPEPEGGEYRLMAADATEAASWLESIPADRPTLVILEGLAPYLTAVENEAMFGAFVARFRSQGGQILFDTVSSVVTLAQRYIAPVAATGATLKWGVDDLSIIEKLAPGLKLVETIRQAENEAMAKMVTSARWIYWFLGFVPYVKNMACNFRCKF
ncbi:S-adenosyl-L-methionine-dependent methyltransferase [Xylariales sp. PMI_506]|nr:S-adenosyl-L-methionine-dependent methyltransferase [Xylariales sp. PMI_506]